MLTKNSNSIAEGLKRLISDEQVLSSKEEITVYEQDATNSKISKKSPDAIVFPKTIVDVQTVLRYASKRNIPVVCRGAGTNLVGGCLTDFGGIVLNFSKMTRIYNLNETDMTVKVEAGVVLGDLLKETEKVGLFFPVDPSNMAVSTIGGAIAQSSGGAKTFKYGTIKDYILGLKVVTADGEIINTGSDTMKNSTGYHLEQLFVGSEGTLGVVVEATLKLIPKPQARRVIMAYFDYVSDAVNSVNEIIKAKLVPSAIEFMDKNSLISVENYNPNGLLTDKEAALIIETDGSDLDLQEEKIVSCLNSLNAVGIKIAKTEDEIENIWKSRRASFAAAAKIAPDVMTEDVIVPRSKLPDLVLGVREICEKYNLKVCMIGHVGDGNLHPQIVLNMEDDVQFKNYMSAKGEIYKLTNSLGGILSAEHGIGSDKSAYMYDVIDKNLLLYMKKMKNMFDPNNILNPGKVFIDK
ncbi:FAD-binding protein [bacterium]|nr:FAD-binding protein [bacterium]